MLGRLKTMTNRREFLRTGVSVSSLPLALNTLLPVAATAGQARHVSVRKAVFDDRYAEGRTFAEAARRLSVPVRALDDGDVTSFWYDELDALWRDRPAAVAGTTQFGPMFVLERLARERGMRVALRVEHCANADGTVTHDISGPTEAIELAEHLQRHGVDWPMLVAVLSTHCPGDGSAMDRRSVTTPGVAPMLATRAASPDTVVHYYASAAVRDGYGIPWDGPLFSWLLAPGSRG
jgi:hypothetical protein